MEILNSNLYQACFTRPLTCFYPFGFSEKKTSSSEEKKAASSSNESDGKKKG